MGEFDRKRAYFLGGRLMDTRSDRYQKVQTIVRVMFALILVFGVLLSPLYLNITWTRMAILPAGIIGCLLLMGLMLFLVDDGKFD